MIVSREDKKRFKAQFFEIHLFLLSRLSKLLSKMHRQSLGNLFKVINEFSHDVKCQSSNIVVGATLMMPRW